MAKRFTDTDIWDKQWFMALKPKEKLLVKFIFDKCDVAGIWSPNWILASTYIGEPVTEKDLVNFSYRLEFLGGGKIFVTDFISFQYGTLSEKCKPHLKIIEILKKYALLDRVIKGYTYPLQRVQEEEQEKEKETEMDKEEEKDLSFESEENFSLTLHIDLPVTALEAVEYNQFTNYKKKNTEFIKSQWRVFLHERINDPPEKQRIYKQISDLTSYFFNWMRTKKPTDGNEKPASKDKAAGAFGILKDVRADFESYAGGK